MKKHKMKKSVGIFAMLAAAIGLLAFSSIGGARAALTIYSQTYESDIKMRQIGISLLENGEPVSHRNYSGNKEWDEDTGELLTEIEKFEFGTKYPEALSVKNTGQPITYIDRYNPAKTETLEAIDEYVILTIRKYWVDENNNKRTDLDPSLIQVKLRDPQEGDAGKWIADTKIMNNEPERIVMIYDTILGPGDETVAATESITVDSAIKAVVETTETIEEDGMTVIITTYSYDGLKFVLEAEAEGVQTHNAADAIRSAWGRQVTIDPNTKKITAIN